MKLLWRPWCWLTDHCGWSILDPVAGTSTTLDGHCVRCGAEL